MSSKKPKLRKMTKKRLIRRFATIMLSTFVGGTILLVGGLVTYDKLSPGTNLFDSFSGLSAEEKKEKEDAKFKTNVAVFGVDIDGYRTDSMFVAHFDAQTNSAALVAVPRDTKVILSSAEYERMRSINRHAPQTMKINEMTAYAGIENIKDFTVKEMERLLGIKIDNYITVEIEAFRKIVDIIGGVTADVPRRMQYYDSAQGLDIDLEPGVQPLDGAAAEGMVRFRKDKRGGGYADGDVGRIQTQQIFLKAFAKKMLSKENIKNFPKMIPAMFKHVKTDINVLDLPKYYGYATSFDVDELGFHTIPGVGRYEGSVSYFFPDFNEMNDFVQEIFYKDPDGNSETSDSDPDEIVEDKSVKIEILNGGAPAGTAGDLERLIKRDGYEVVSIGNYTGDKEDDIKIYARDRKQAQQFKQYFDNCNIYEDNSMARGIDIQIVIGSKGI